MPPSGLWAVPAICLAEEAWTRRAFVQKLVSVHTSVNAPGIFPRC
jgi:hypothetical protein